MKTRSCVIERTSIAVKIYLRRFASERGGKFFH
jgi:hypothetical protein